MELIALSLLALSVACYSCSQLAQHGKIRFSKTDEDFFGVGSWHRKYTYDPPKDNWYYKFFDIRMKERYLFSSTFLVAFTDFYHLSQSISFLCLSGCVSLLSGINFFYIWLGVIFVHATVYKLLSK